MRPQASLTAHSASFRLRDCSRDCCRALQQTDTQSHKHVNSEGQDRHTTTNKQTTKNTDKTHQLYHDGSGYVRNNMDKAHYRDAIVNRKAKVILAVHETSGCLSRFAANRLNKLAFDARESGTDPTDYGVSYTASSFVPYYAQLMSDAVVMDRAAGIIAETDEAVKQAARAT